MWAHRETWPYKRSFSRSSSIQVQKQSQLQLNHEINHLLDITKLPYPIPLNIDEQHATMPPKPQKRDVAKDKDNTTTKQELSHATRSRPQHPKGVPTDLHHNDDDYFAHINIPSPQIYITSLPTPPTFNFATKEVERIYLQSVRAKLTLTKFLILEEQRLNLDIDRPGVHKSATTTLLAQGPFKIDLHAQQLVRMVLEETKELKELARQKSVDDPEVEQAMIEFWLFWTQLRTTVAWQIPGKSWKEKEDRADAIMEGVLEKMVEP